MRLRGVSAALPPFFEDDCFEKGETGDLVALFDKMKHEYYFYLLFFCLHSRDWANLVIEDRGRRNARTLILHGFFLGSEKQNKTNKNKKVNSERSKKTIRGTNSSKMDSEDAWVSGTGATGARLTISARWCCAGFW